MKVYILTNHFTDIDVQTNVMGVFSTLDKAKDAGKDSEHTPLWGVSAFQWNGYGFDPLFEPRFENLSFKEHGAAWWYFANAKVG